MRAWASDAFAPTSDVSTSSSGDVLLQRLSGHYEAEFSRSFGFGQGCQGLRTGKPQTPICLRNVPEVIWDFVETYKAFRAYQV